MPTRATIDTNVLISGAIFPQGAPRTLLKAVQAGSVLPVTSSEQIGELDNVLRRPKFRDKYAVTDSRRAAFINWVRVMGVLTEPIAVPEHLGRDPKDRHIIGAALAGSAAFIVSGDNDLLVLDGHPLLGSLRIVTATEFLAFLGGP